MNGGDEKEKHISDVESKANNIHSVHTQAKQKGIDEKDNRNDGE